MLGTAMRVIAHRSSWFVDKFDENKCWEALEMLQDAGEAWQKEVGSNVGQMLHIWDDGESVDIIETTSVMEDEELTLFGKIIWELGLVQTGDYGKVEDVLKEVHELVHNFLEKRYEELYPVPSKKND